MPRLLSLVNSQVAFEAAVLGVEQAPPVIYDSAMECLLFDNRPLVHPMRMEYSSTSTWRLAQPRLRQRTD